MSFKPVFETGLILKKHMLEALRDYPIDYVHTLFSEMGDGVISGLDVVITDGDQFYIKEGIVKIDGIVYIINQSGTLSFEEGKNYVYLCVNSDNQADGTYFYSEVIQKKQEENAYFELFRYIKNAEVKKYSSVSELFADMTNRIDQRRLLQSVRGGHTLSNEYYYLFAKEILDSSNAGMNDIAFAYQCLNEISGIEIIKKYFLTDDLSNKNILSLMRIKLEKMQKSVKEIAADAKPKIERKISVE